MNNSKQLDNQPQITDEQLRQKLDEYQANGASSNPTPNYFTIKNTCRHQLDITPA